MRGSKYTDGMISRIRTGEISLWIQFTFYVASFLTVILRTSNSLADTSYYFLSGELISQGQNPYSGDLPYFSGPVGGLFLYVVGKMLFIQSFPFIWQIVNLAGLSLFFFTILSKLRVHSNFIFLIGIMLLSSPVREMVTNNQVTGFVLGLAAFVIHTSSHNLHTSLFVANSILLYLVFELKPNLILGFAIYFIFIHRKRILLIFLTMASTFWFFNLVLTDNLYLNWLNSIRAQGVANLSGYELLGLSTFIYEMEILSEDKSRVLGISLFLFCLAVTLAVAFFDRSQATLFTIPLLAIFFPYLHYLDLAVAVPFVVHFIFNGRYLRSFAPIAIILLYLPRPTDDFPKNILILVLLAMFILINFARCRSLRMALGAILLGVSLLASNYLIAVAIADDHQLQSLTVIRAWIVTSILLIWAIIKELKVDFAHSSIRQRFFRNIV